MTCSIHNEQRTHQHHYYSSNTVGASRARAAHIPHRIRQARTASIASGLATKSSAIPPQLSISRRSVLALTATTRGLGPRLTANGTSGSSSVRSVGSGGSDSLWMRLSPPTSGSIGVMAE